MQHSTLPCNNVLPSSLTICSHWKALGVIMGYIETTRRPPQVYHCAVALNARVKSAMLVCGSALVGNIWAVSELQLSSEYLEIRSHLWCQPTSSPMIETHTQHPQYWTRTIYNTIPGQGWRVVGGMIWPLDVDWSPSMWWEVMVTPDKLSLMCNWRKPNLASGPVH